MKAEIYAKLFSFFTVQMHPLHSEDAAVKKTLNTTVNASGN
jgi:hypothetical protein